MSPFTLAGSQIHPGSGTSTVEGTSVPCAALSRDAFRYFLEFTYRRFGCGPRNPSAYSNQLPRIRPSADSSDHPKGLFSLQVVVEAHARPACEIRFIVVPVFTAINRRTRKVATDDIPSAPEPTISNG